MFLEVTIYSSGYAGVDHIMYENFNYFVLSCILFEAFPLGI